MKHKITGINIGKIIEMVTVSKDIVFVKYQDGSEDYFENKEENIKNLKNKVEEQAYIFLEQYKYRYKNFKKEAKKIIIKDLLGLILVSIISFTLLFTLPVTITNIILESSIILLYTPTIHLNYKKELEKLKQLKKDYIKYTLYLCNKEVIEEVYKDINKEALAYEKSVLSLEQKSLDDVKNIVLKTALYKDIMEEEKIRKLRK
ncbi:MAG: hypothetical protein IJZ36_02650 [Bacilli bacterium]|nr:hypothetical protein [Bacilli bacterium]